jgi:hypothetical protein
MATAVTQTDTDSAARARNVCVVMLSPHVFAHLARIGSGAEIRQ